MAKVGIVLEGGAMRGMFTAGVLDVFLENQITVDAMIGVSAGATFGCNFKSKQIGRTIRYNKLLSHDWRYCSIRSLLKTGDLYGADFCYNTIPNEIDLFDYDTYRKNPMPFYVVASNCETGLPLYYKLENCDDHDFLWMRASASMPLVSTPVEVDGLTLLDGGMTDSIPLKFFESIGYKKNIVILTQPRDFVKKPNKAIFLMRLALKKFPKLVDAMARRHEIYNEETKYVFEQESRGDTFVICPESPLNISRTEKNPAELQRCYDEGRRIAKIQLEKIKAFLA